MSVKLLMTWDILPGREQEYFEFVVREFIPAMQRLGLEPSDAWFTMYGQQPQIMAAAVMETQDGLETVLKSDDWRTLTGQLLEYVDEFKFKIVPAKTGFQM